MRAPLRLLALAAILPLLFSAPELGAQGSAAPHPLLESYRRARALLDRAVVAHGGAEALREARQVSVTLRGWDRWRNQSRAVAPLDSSPHEAAVRIDLAKERIVFEQRFSYPGEIHRGTKTVTDGARSFRADPRAATYSRAQWPPASQQSGNLFYLPQHILAASLENPATLRYLGRMRLSSGVEAEAIATSIAGGQLSLAFDPATGRLRATVGVWGDAAGGDIVQETEFPSYQPLGGLLMPTRRVSWVGGTRTRDLAYVEARGGYSVTDADVAFPEGFTEATASAPLEPVRAIGDGVWLVSANGPSVLAVAMRDYVVVIDAPPSLDRGVLDRIAKLAGKPVRYAVPTHHHDDHASGVRSLADAGVTILTTPGNRDYLAGIVSARASVGPWTLPRAAGAPPPSIEVIAGGKRVITDGTRTLELLDIGEGPHAKEMLVAWLPAERILFQGDLIDVSADGALTRGANNATTMHFARWLDARGIRPATYAGAHGTLRDAAEFARLIALPILE